MSNEITNLEKELEQAENKISELEDEISDLQDDDTMAQAERDELRREIEDLEGNAEIPYLTVNDQLKADILIEYWEKIKLDDIDKMIAGLKHPH